MIPQFPRNQSLLHFHLQNLHYCCYLHPYLPLPFWSLPFLLKSVPYWSHLIFVVNEFCIIQINAIFVIIALTKLTQAGKIPFINTILFGCHILSDEFFGYLVWAYRPKKMGKMDDTIQYSLSANKKNWRFSIFLSSSEPNTASFSFQNWYSSAAFCITISSSNLSACLCFNKAVKICSSHDWFQNTPNKTFLLAKL